MKPLKEKLNATVDGDVLEKLKNLAENDDRTLSGYVNIVLKAHVEKEKDKLIQIENRMKKLK